MERKEIKKALENSDNTINNIWRSLWHPFYKRKSSISWKNNRRDWFLEWSTKSRICFKRN